MPGLGLNSFFADIGPGYSPLKLYGVYLQRVQDELRPKAGAPT